MSSFHFSLKTGFLKWKPDYDSAASEYGKAGMCDDSPVTPICSLNVHLGRILTLNAFSEILIVKKTCPSPCFFPLVIFRCVEG